MLLLVACSSLPKAELEQSLRALEKNATLGELERLTFTADLGDGPQELELVYHHTRATDPVDTVPIVLIHSTPSTLFSWTELIRGTPADAQQKGFEGLGSKRDVYALEVIGHGMAPGDASPTSFERCARFVTAALRALQLERVHLVGSSYGGEFAWRAALNEPELIASLTVIDSSGIRRREEDWLPEEIVMRDNSLAKFGWMLNSRERIETALAPHFRELPPDRVEEFFLVCENAENWKAMIDLVRDENGQREGELGDLQPPTLVLWGAEDIAYPLEVYGQKFASAIRGAELVALPNCGHYPHEERPAEVVRVLSRFFDSQVTETSENSVESPLDPPTLSPMTATPPTQLVIDFSSETELAQWSAVDDVVMGGVSSSELLATASETALFTGNLSLDSGGGFASVRSRNTSYDLVGAAELALRVRGDGKRYQLRLRTTKAFDGISYLASFETTSDTWTELTFTPDDFVASWRGRTVESAPALALEDVRSFGFLIADLQAGAFALEIAWIAKRSASLTQR